MAIAKESHVLLAVHITDRLKKAPLVQATLSKYGDTIRTRLGLHQVSKDYSSPGGVLVLDIVDETKARRLQKSMDKIPGVETKLVVFKH